MFCEKKISELCFAQTYEFIVYFAERNACFAADFGDAFVFRRETLAVVVDEKFDLRVSVRCLD